MSELVPTLPEGASLLNDLSNFIRRYVALSPAQADICALWTTHTHAMDAADLTPYLNITSPMPRSGKTTLQQLLSLLVYKPWYAARVTAAVLVRKTDREHATLLLDESDAAFNGNREYAEALRGLLNSGYERNGTCSLCVPPNWEAKNFSAFCPKAIAGIGKLPDTVEDRSIPIVLKRKLPNEYCDRFRRRKVVPAAEELREQVAMWAAQQLESLGTAEPEMPLQLNDRQLDVCEPLVAIADGAGGDWPCRARQGLIELLTGQTLREDSEIITLLADIRHWFDTRRVVRMKSSDLVYDLQYMEDAPWGEPERGYPLTATRLARLLRPLDIRPRDLRFTEGIFKGYERAGFEEAWARYLPPLSAPSSPAVEGQQPLQVAVNAGSDHVSTGQQSANVAPAKVEEMPANMRAVADVAPLEAKRAETRTAEQLEAITHVIRHPIRRAIERRV
jgi:hypothetical protein